MLDGSEFCRLYLLVTSVKKNAEERRGRSKQNTRLCVCEWKCVAAVAAATGKTFALSQRCVVPVTMNRMLHFSEEEKCVEISYFPAHVYLYI